MKVFLSWSGERSKQVAVLLKTWLKCVIQSVEPWMSSQDISRGELWYNAINNQISQISTGIICLTEENKEKPWILFESGALAKGITTNHIITFLIDVKSEDLLLSPLSAFNHTTPDKEGVFKMVLTINNLLAAPLDDLIIGKVFEMFWPSFEDQFNAIMGATKNETPQKHTKTSVTENSDILKSLLLTVRNLENGVSKIIMESRTVNDTNVNMTAKRKYDERTAIYEKEIMHLLNKMDSLVLENHVLKNQLLVEQQELSDQSIKHSKS